MHGQRYIIRELQYGTDGTSLFLRLDLEEHQESSQGMMQARLTVKPQNEESVRNVLTVQFGSGSATALHADLFNAAAVSGSVEFAFRKILEIRISLEALGVRRGQPLRLQLSLWKAGLPMDALPPQGWIEIPTAEPTEWPG
jgi:hypothetical protein